MVLCSIVSNLKVETRGCILDHGSIKLLSAWYFLKTNVLRKWLSKFIGSVKKKRSHIICLICLPSFVSHHLLHICRHHHTSSYYFYFFSESPTPLPIPKANYCSVPMSSHQMPSSRNPGLVKLARPTSGALGRDSNKTMTLGRRMRCIYNGVKNTVEFIQNALGQFPPIIEPPSSSAKRFLKHWISKQVFLVICQVLDILLKKL